MNFHLYEQLMRKTANMSAKYKTCKVYLYGKENTKNSIRRNMEFNFT